MPLSRTQGNTRDENEAALFAVARQVGATVEPLDTPGDALIGYRGVTYLIEIKPEKGPRRNRFTAAQKAFRKRWKGQYSVVRTPEDLLEVIGARSRVVGRDCR